MTRKVIDIRKSIPRHKTRKWRKRNLVDKIVIHTTASNNQDPNKTARYHSTPSKDNHLSKQGAPGLSYHDFITKDGTVFHCNNYSDITWHTKGWNKAAIGIALAFKGQTGEPPTAAQELSLKEHLVILCLYMKVLPENIKGHREGPGMLRSLLGKGPKKYKKTCPGWGINLDSLRNEVTCRLQKRLAAERLYTGKIDGAFGPKSKKALKLFDPASSYKGNLVNWRYKRNH